MSTKDRVFSRLFDKRQHGVELKKAEAKLETKKKVTLSLVGDIENDFDWLEQSYSEASYGVEFMEEWEQRIYDFSNELSLAVDNYVINGAARSLEENAQDMREKLGNLDFKANELGINPADLVANYSEIAEILANSDSINTDFRAAYKEVLKASNNVALADFS